MKNKGITLIALVITIIILLILAGITISQLTGSGLFEKTQLAKERIAEAEQDEKDKLSLYENKLSNYLITTRDYTPINYSTDEQDTGLKWIDNKPIYRKVVNFSESTSSYDKVRYMGKSIVNDAESLIDSGGYIILNGIKKEFGTTEINWNCVPAFHSYAQILSNNTLEIYVLYNSDNYSDNPITGTVWVEYTKKDKEE